MKPTLQSPAIFLAHCVKKSSRQLYLGIEEQWFEGNRLAGNSLPFGDGLKRRVFM
jgi:hypothetical protein